MRFNRVIALAMVAMAVSSCRAGHDAQQLVKESPATVYAAFADAYSQASMGGASQYSDLWHGAMQNMVEKTSATTLDVFTKFDGKTATAVHFTFTPEDGGKATLVEADIKVDHAVVHDALTGTPKESEASLPDAAFATGMQRILAKYASRIEAGAPLNDPRQSWITGNGDPPPEFYEGMPEQQRAEIRHEEDEQHQESATAATVDPDAAARSYMGGQAPSN